MKRTVNLWILALGSSLLVSCGKSDDKREVASGSSSLSTDSATAEQSVAASLEEAMDSLSDGQASQSSNSLALADQPSGILERTCEVDGDKAIVRVKAERSLASERSTRRFAFSISNELLTERVRTWSSDSGPVACEGQRAAIDLSADLTGYKLDVTVKRQVGRTQERKNLQSNEIVKQSYQASVNGQRSVAWLKQSNLGNGSISRETSISFDVTRDMNITDKDGAIRPLSLRLSTPEGAPLQVINIWQRDSTTQQPLLVSQEIKSGTIQSVKTGDATIEAGFENLKLTFTSSTCQIVSGKMTAEITPEGANEASRSYVLTVENGEVKVEDVTDPANPKAVEDFNYSPCDLRDFKD